MIALVFCSASRSESTDNAGCFSRSRQPPQHRVLAARQGATQTRSLPSLEPPRLPAGAPPLKLGRLQTSLEPAYVSGRFRSARILGMLHRDTFPICIATGRAGPGTISRPLAAACALKRASGSGGASTMVNSARGIIRCDSSRDRSNLRAHLPYHKTIAPDKINVVEGRQRRARLEFCAESLAAWPNHTIRHSDTACGAPT